MSYELETPPWGSRQKPRCANQIGNLTFDVQTAHQRNHKPTGLHIQATSPEHACRSLCAETVLM